MMLLLAGAGHAAPYGHLEFRDPTGTSGPTDPIDVWMRFSLDPASAPLVLDSSVPGLGVNPADVPDAWHHLTRAVVTVNIGCYGGFIGPTCVGPYTFVFDTGPDSLNETGDIQLLPGVSIDFRLGSFVPTAGSVANGTYDFHHVQFALFLEGRIPAALQPLLDENGEQVYDENGPVYVPLAEVENPTEFYPETTGYLLGETTFGDIPFERTVVPLPATLPLMLGALAAAGVIRRSAQRNGALAPRSRMA